MGKDIFIKIDFLISVDDRLLQGQSQRAALT